METVKYIFGKSESIDNVGDIYPVKLRNYDEFIECSNHLYISKNHFSEEYQEYQLLDLLIFGLKDEKLISDMEKLLSLVTNQKVEFSIKNEEQYAYILENGNLITKHNYDKIREVIMRQNLMFEQKVYKDKRVQSIMYKVFEARAKNSVRMEFEDMISTVSVFTGKHYWDLAEYTVYQLKADFNRITKFKAYDTSVSAKIAGSETNIEYFAENLDMFKNPYDLENFTRSKDSISKLNNAIK